MATYIMVGWKNWRAIQLKRGQLDDALSRGANSTEALAFC
jgi:hypothetical protein